MARHALLEGLAFAAAAAAVAPWDEASSDEFHDRKLLGPDAVDWGYWLGHRYTVAGSIGVLGAAGLLSGRPYIAESGVLLLEAQLLSAGLTQALKYLTNRERPDESNRLSMPSGHATGAWTTAALLQGRFGWRVGVPAHLASIYVGASRVQGRKHHWSDVLVGFGIAQWATRAVLNSTSAQGESDARVEWMPLTSARFDGNGIFRVRF